MTNVLGGPGVACSITRIRRLEAGELAGDERARTEEHLAGCGRCQASRRELEEEREALAAELPFETFAAGVAEKLAAPRPGPPMFSAARARFSGNFARFALAAGIAAAVQGLVWVTHDRDAGEIGWRVKGPAELALWVSEQGGARLLPTDEPVPRGAALRVGLPLVPRRFAAVALVDRDGVVVLHAGASAPGPLSGAFEWTGEGEGTLVAVFDDRPVDGAALASRLARGGITAASPGGPAEVLVRPLRREPR